MGFYFEDFEEGKEFTSPRRTITETDLVVFTAITGLKNPVFTDEVFAKEVGLGTRVIPGPLTMCIAMGLTDDLIYGTTFAALGVKEAKFRATVKPGDTIWVKTTVSEKRESSSHPDKGIITLRHHVYNERNEEVMVFERTLMMLKKP